MTNPDITPRIRSFVLRGGRIGPGQAKAIDALSTRYVLPFEGTAIDFARVFGRIAPVIVEIGFGMGDATAAIAASRPEVDFIGIEVHPPGVGALLRKIDERGLTNIRIVRSDAVDVLEHGVAPASLAGISIFFPDPWPKKRHVKRRLLQAPFAALAASRLARAGMLHAATDWQPYAEQMLEVLSAEPHLINTAPGYSPRPESRPMTKFEARGLDRGHEVFDLVFVRRS